MNLQFIPIYADNPLQNTVWAIVHPAKREAVVVDPNAAEPVQRYLHDHQLSLVAIWITHDHHDHVSGLADLYRAFPQACIYAHPKHKLPKSMAAQVLVEEKCSIGKHMPTGSFELWGNRVRVWSLEGHKRYHVGFLLDLPECTHVFCGDILFRAGCGRVFEGTPDELFASLKRLSDLPDNTLYYPAHEFTVNNLIFALTIEPANQDMLAALADATKKRSQKKPTLPTSLADEKRINPFLRTHKKQVVDAVAAKAQLTDDHPAAVFAALRKLKDHF